MGRYRDSICILLGSVGFMHELIVAQIERPYILAASLALLGAPLVFSVENKFKERNKKEGE